MKMVRLHGLAMIIELLHVKWSTSLYCEFPFKIQLNEKKLNCTDALEISLICISQTLSKSFFRLADADSDLEKTHKWDMQATT
jgi:hypothetical protein